MEQIVKVVGSGGYVMMKALAQNRDYCKATSNIKRLNTAKKSLWFPLYTFLPVKLLIL